jgi:hypothetical protein
VLVIRSREPDGAKRISTVVPRTKHRLRLMVVWTALAIVAGTVVTGTGPHAGDDKARRFTFLSITWVARIHSAIVWVAVLMAISLLWHLRKRAHDREVLDAPLTLWMCVAIAQGAVGYLQYANGVPAVLVALHVALATTLWATSVWLWCTTSRASGTARSMIAASRRPSAAATEATGELAELVDCRAEERADWIDEVDRRVAATCRVLPQPDHHERNEQIKGDLHRRLELSENAGEHVGASGLDETDQRTGLERVSTQMKC